MGQPVTYKGASTVGLSQNIWHDCPIEQIERDPGVGYGFMERWDKGGLLTAPTTIANLFGGSQWSGFSSSASQVTRLAAVAGGVRIAETTTDEATSIYMQTYPFNMTSLGGALWFEARVTPSHTATTEQSMFVGLMDSTAKTAIIPLIAAAGALADANLVGFHKLDTDLTSVKSAYKANTVAAVTVQTATSALAAATAVKLGFKFSPVDQKLRFFIDNVELATTKTIPNATGTDFPADALMGVVIAMAVGVAAADNTLDTSWVSCYQLRV